MKTEQGGVMSIKEMEEAGLQMPEYTEDEIDAGSRKIPVVRQKPATNEGILVKNHENEQGTTKVS